jgi:hypothetical protein
MDAKVPQTGPERFYNLEAEPGTRLEADVAEVCGRCLKAQNRVAAVVPSSGTRLTIPKDPVHQIAGIGHGVS